MQDDKLLRRHHRKAHVVHVGLHSAELEENRQVSRGRVQRRADRLVRPDAQSFLAHRSVVLVRQDDIEAVAEGVEDEESIGDGDDNDHGVVEGPLYISDIFANEASLRDRLQLVDLFRIGSCSLVFCLRGRLTSCLGCLWLRHLGIMTILSVDR